MLHCASEAARDIFDNFDLALDSEDTTCDIVLAKFRDYYNPRRKPAFESYKFWQRRQAEGEPFDKYEGQSISNETFSIAFVFL